MFDDPSIRTLNCAGRILRLDHPRVMGIVNVTPDSFSDGGCHADPGAAVAFALDLIAQGADVLDVGGESTRPGADAVPLEQELARVVPAIERLAAQCRSEEQTSELQSLMRNSYGVFCLKKQKDKLHDEIT